MNDEYQGYEAIAEVSSVNETWKERRKVSETERPSDEIGIVMNDWLTENNWAAGSNQWVLVEVRVAEFL